MIQTQAHKIVNLTPPQAIVNGGSWTVAALDTLGWDYADIYLILGATDIALTVALLTESDDDSSYSTVSGSSYAVAPATLPSATDDNHVFAWHINKASGQRKRYHK